MYSLDNGEYSTYHAFSKIRIFFALTGQSTKTRIHNIRNVLSVLQFLRVDPSVWNIEICYREEK